jgi:phosphatidylserine/phosphatidylglycerophosphate/cardiolipin synthase-like enzyme
VVVEVILPAPTAGGPSAPQLTRLSQARIAIRYSARLYMHAKLMLVDSARGFVSSVNCSTTSRDANREIGVVLAEPVALNLLASTFATDWQTGTPA